MPPSLTDSIAESNSCTGAPYGSKSTTSNECLLFIITALASPSDVSTLSATPLNSMFRLMLSTTIGSMSFATIFSTSPSISRAYRIDRSPVAASPSRTLNPPSLQVRTTLDFCFLPPCCSSSMRTF